MSIRIVNRQDGDDEGYMIRQSANAFEFSIPQLNAQFPAESRNSIPYNQDAFIELAGLIATLQTQSLVEAGATNLDQYGLTTENHVARAGVTFRDGKRTAFMLGNPAPISGQVYFRFADNSSDVYTVSLHHVSPLMMNRFHWLSREAFPEYIPGLEVERLSIDRVDWREEGVGPMVIERIPTPENATELRSHNRHRLTKPIEIDICPENSLPVLVSMYSLTADKVVAVGCPESPEMSDYGFDTPAVIVEMTDQLGTVMQLVIGGHLSDENGTNLGWFGISSHVPHVVYLFAGETLPWLNTSIDRLHAASFLQPHIYSIDTVTLETPDTTLVFTITGDEHESAIMFEGAELTGEHSNSATARGRFADLYMYLISARMAEVFIGETPPESELIARITYSYRGDTPDDVVEYYTAENFLSIVRVNGVNIYKLRAEYTRRLVSNISAFAEGGEIINDF
jgi:hypothetical protein